MGAMLAARGSATISVVSVLLVALGTSGCYLGHLASGQARMLCARESIESLLADDDTSKELRERLRLVQSARGFAAGLGLDVGGQYTSYVPWEGDRVVTIVVATRPGEVEPAGYTFPIGGTVPYKGFFDPERAETEAEKQRGRGRDVCVVGVSAYSTLGWLDDPVTGPMLRRGAGPLVDTVIHELVHATVYVSDEARFNEGVANFIGGEASVQFFAERGETERARLRRSAIADERRIGASLESLRAEVTTLYASEQPGAEREAARRALTERARETLRGLPLDTLDPARVARDSRLNDACLALSGTYSDDLDDYAELLTRTGGSLRAFLQRVLVAAKEADPLDALKNGRR